MLRRGDALAADMDGISVDSSKWMTHTFGSDFQKVVTAEGV
jgi:hypothetical protein